MAKNAFECNLKGNKQSRRRKVTTKLHPLIVDIVLFFTNYTENKFRIRIWILSDLIEYPCRFI